MHKQLGDARATAAVGKSPLFGMKPGIAAAHPTPRAQANLLRRSGQPGGSRLPIAWATPGSRAPPGSEARSQQREGFTKPRGAALEPPTKRPYLVVPEGEAEGYGEETAHTGKEGGSEPYTQIGSGTTGMYSPGTGPLGDAGG